MIENDDYAAQVIAAPDYPVRDKAVLPAPPTVSLAGQRPTDATVTLLDIAPEHLGVRASTSADALLLISIPYHPGWKASANGQTLTVIRADLGLMAIPLPAGSYELSLDFRPASVQIGKLISAITALFIVVALAGWAVIRRRSTPQRITKLS